MLTALLVVLGMGFTIQYEDAIAANVTIIPTEDNRVRYSAVHYTDGVTCNVGPYNKRFSYNTVADAEAAWLAKAPPFKTTRGRTAFIHSQTCGAFLSGSGGIGFYAYLCYFFLILGIPLDCLCIRHSCECCRDRHCCASRSATIVPTKITVTVHEEHPTSTAPQSTQPGGATEAESR